MFKPGDVVRACYGAFPIGSEWEVKSASQSGEWIELWGNTGHGKAANFDLVRAADEKNIETEAA